jgi:FMN phosphatase YigB (HAD superfamily)
MTFAMNGVDVPEEPFCHELYRYYSCAEAYSAYPDAIPALKRLSEGGVTMGVISDFDERLGAILTGLGMRGYLKFIVQGFVEGHDKPAAELWRAAVRKTGVRVDEAWHVGDDPERDAFTDPRTVIVNREVDKTRISTDVETISTLEELPALVLQRV